MYKYYEIELNEKTLIKQNKSLKLLLFSIMVDLQKYIKLDLTYCEDKKEIKDNQDNKKNVSKLMVNLIKNNKDIDNIKNDLIAIINYYNYRKIEIIKEV